MGNTFSCLNVHGVFSTKERVPLLNPEVREASGLISVVSQSKTGFILSALAESLTMFLSLWLQKQP
jgi:hypothetical protein